MTKEYDLDDLMLLRDNIADKDHWVQGRLGNPMDGMCVVGHISNICLDYNWESMSWGDAYSTKACHLQMDLDYLSYKRYGRNIVALNDSLSFDAHSQILNVIDEAIRIEKEALNNK